MTKKILLAIIACSLCASLAAGHAIFAADAIPGQQTSPQYPKAAAFEDYDAQNDIREKNPVDETFIDAMNGFAAKSSSKLLKRRTGNYTYSPVSAYMALSLATAGSDGLTQKELLSALGLDKQGVSYLATQNANLFCQMYQDNEVGQLKIANSLWMDDDYSFQKDYLNTASKQFYASLFNLDLSDEAAGEQMGQWIAENTNGSLTPKMKLSKDLAMTILNTVYFKDQWMNKFEPSATKEDIFHLADGNTVRCDFMNRSFSSSFVKGKNYTAAALGLKNGGEMTFILPDKGVKTDDLLFSADKVSELLEGGEEKFGEVIFKLPKFSFNTDIDLNSTLKDLGIKEAFKDNADFSKMSADNDLFISQVKQQTHVAIDENGVEASAFTQIDMAGCALPVDTAEMILNRPFIFTITDRSGVILFMGVVNDPTQK